MEVGSTSPSPWSRLGFMFMRVRIPGEDEIGLQHEIAEDPRLESAQIHAE
jgi:hypothetical protein